MTRVLQRSSLALGILLWVAPVGFADRIGLGKGFRPPPFTATDLAGHEQTLEGYAGQVLVLHFWASWCPYCRKEIPKLQTLQEDRWTSDGVRVIAVSTDHDPSTLKQFIKERGVTYPVIADGEHDLAISEQYGISGIPVTYVIGRDGRIVKRLDGSSDIVGTVEEALKASVPHAS